jgi:uncharacterized membrane protein
MSSITLALAIFGIMLVFMAVRVPIAVAMFAAGGIGYVMQTGWGRSPASSIPRPSRALPATTCQ